MSRLFLLFFYCFVFFAMGSSSEIQIKAINSRANILYVGIDNELSIRGISDTRNLLLEIDNGMIIRDNQRFYAIPKKPGDAKISLYRKSESGKEFIKDQILQVNPFPKPRLKINGVIVGQDESIPKAMLMHSDSLGLGIYYTDDIIGIESWYKVASFTMGYVYGNHYMSKRGRGNRLNDECKELLKTVPPNSELVIRMIIESNDIITETRPIFRINVF